MAEKRFRTLRTLATLLKVLGVIFLILGVIGGSLMVGIGSVGGGPFRGVFDEMVGPGAASGFAAAAAGISIILMSVIYFVVLFGAGEALYLLIALEENTRETANLTRELWTTFGPPKRPTGIQPLRPAPEPRAAPASNPPVPAEPPKARAT